MKTSLKIIHILSLILFLGSIFTYILISAMIENALLSDLAFGRSIISRGTSLLTLPALWMVLITGILMRKEAGISFFKTKLVTGILILANAHIFVAGAVALATSLALDAETNGVLSTKYHQAYLKESVFGAMNILLAMFALWYAVSRKKE